MSKTSIRLADVEPIADPPAYLYLQKHAGEIADLLTKAEMVTGKPGSVGLLTSLQRRTPAEWDRVVWQACVKFGPDAVRVAGRCLKKRGYLWFLPKAKTHLRVFVGGKQ